MSNAKAQPQLVCVLIEQYPDLTTEIAEVAEVTFPDHDEAVAGSGSHPMADGSTLQSDATVRFQKDGKAAFLAHVEMQRKY